MSYLKEIIYEQKNCTNEVVSGIIYKFLTHVRFNIKKSDTARF